MAATIHPHRDRSEAAPSLLVDTVRGVSVIRPQGALDQTVAEQVRAALRDAAGPVAIDLDECTLIDPDSLERMVVDADGPPEAEVSIVCRRLTCRQLLGRAGIADRVAVFVRLGDALQARVFEADGYGDGWTPRRG